MYVVLMAMLALNVSNEVLNGFSIVEESLNRTTSGSIKENKLVYDNLDMQMRLNPTKVGQWYNKAQEVKRMSDSLYNFAEELKLAIVQEADGKDGQAVALHGAVITGFTQGQGFQSVIGSLLELLVLVVVFCCPVPHLLPQRVGRSLLLQLDMVVGELFGIEKVEQLIGNLDGLLAIEQPQQRVRHLSLCPATDRDQ